MSFSSRVREIILAVPEGRVVTYGQVAMLAGNPRGARGVVWILRSSSGRYDLPWHRVVAAGGRIALKEGEGKEEQIALLSAEDVPIINGKVEMSRCQWRPQHGL